MLYGHGTQKLFLMSMENRHAELEVNEVWEGYRYQYWKINVSFNEKQELPLR